MLRHINSKFRETKFFFLFCNLFVALAYRLHGLVFKNVAQTKLIVTGSVVHAATFSARGHVGAGGLDFGAKISPSEMHGKILRPKYLGNGASQKRKERKFCVTVIRVRASPNYLERDPSNSWSKSEVVYSCRLKFFFDVPAFNLGSDHLSP